MTRETAKADPSHPAKTEPTAPAKPTAGKTAASQPEATDIWDANGETMEAIVKSNGALASGMTAIGQEVMTFANRRLGETMDRSESLMQCKDPEQAFAVSCDFAQKAATQYLEEANRLVAMANEVTRACWAPLEEQTRKTLRGINGDGK